MMILIFGIIDWNIFKYIFVKLFLYNQYIEKFVMLV